MTYEQLKKRIPDGIPKKVKKPAVVGPRSAINFFLLTMLIFIFFGIAVQLLLGMTGVAVTEVFFLVISLLYVKIKRLRFRDVFPVAKPKLTAILGTIILWIGTFLFAIVCDSIVLAFNPDFPASSDSEVIMSSGLPWIILFIIVCILPPICEEAMHRGVIQYGLRKKINNPWVMAVVIGLIFGIYHLDSSKFVTTALLGGVMGWILFQTNNMVYSSLFHFIHNGSQMLLMTIAGTVTAKGILPANGFVLPIFASAISDYYFETGQMIFSSGLLTIFLGAVIPILLYTGNFLLLRDTAPRKAAFFPGEDAKRKKVKRKLLLSTFSLVGIGALLVLVGGLLLL